MKALCLSLLIALALAGCKKEDDYPCLVCTGIKNYTTDKPVSNSPYPIIDTTVYDLCDHPDWEHLLEPYGDTSISYIIRNGDTAAVLTSINLSTCVRK